MKKSISVSQYPSLKLLNGALIPSIGFGTAFKKDGQINDFQNALKSAILVAKYKHLDCAWYYQTEKYIGPVLNDLFTKKLVNRNDLFITSKVWPCFWNDPQISLNQSLNDLQLDYLDLYIQHWPACFVKQTDENGNRVSTPVYSNGDTIIDKSGDYLETYKKMLSIQSSNPSAIRAIGVSNYSIPMLQRLMSETNTKPVVNQIELHPHLPQLQLTEFCNQHGIIVEAYSPFGSLGAPNLQIPIIKSLARQYNVTPADIIISYFQKRNVVCLPRSSNVERIAKGFNIVKLSNKDVKKINDFGVAYSKRYIDKDWGYWNN